MKRNRIIYIAMLIASGIFVYNLPGSISSIIFYILLVAPFMSFIVTLFVYSRFKITQDITAHTITKGDKILYTCTLHNEDLFAYPIMRVEISGASLLFHNQYTPKDIILLPKAKHTLSIPLTCSYRGVYQIGVEAIHINDYFNLFHFKFRSIDHKTILVYPKTLFFRNLYIKKSASLESGSKKPHKVLTNESLSEIKAYQPGDLLHHIHWKLSAKHQEWMSKKMESITDEKFLIFLNTNKPCDNYEKNIVIEDKIIETLVSLVRHMTKSDVAIELAYRAFANQPLLKYPIYSYEPFLNHAAKISFQGNTPFEYQISNFMNKNQSWSSEKEKHFIITSEIDQNLITHLVAYSTKGYSIRLFFIDSKKLIAINEESKKLKENGLLELKKAGIKTYLIDLEDDIRILLEGETL